jgi:hypothetical protein
MTEEDGKLVNSGYDRGGFWEEWENLHKRHNALQEKLR